ncbi:hypothetical protein CJ030_MR3G015839 [Morella rubra]|uniref:Uncharacterized protein n=1 Tax=Morella rubra TaxID=262757 RepID=A0A6A1W8E4_9ROSI|nr:hypothetical protein CJ030_MR3G015839 [Morella rubra]
MGEVPQPPRCTARGGGGIPPPSAGRPVLGGQTPPVEGTSTGKGSGPVFISPISPISPGEKVEAEDADELNYLENTMSFDDTEPAEDEFETRVVNLSGETQVLNICGETQVLDDADCIENMGTQLLDELDNELPVILEVKELKFWVIVMCNLMTTQKEKCCVS